MLVALMLPFASQAQTLTVCDGTVNSQYVPFDGYNADAAQHNQMLYPATDLTAMNGQAITQMVFYIDQSASNGSNTAASRLGTWTVSLGETTATTLSALDNTTTLTQVYQGYFDCSTGTLTLEFDQAYAYNGGNLLVDLNHAAASWNRWYFLGMTTTADASYNSDDDESYTFLPKCTFSYGAVPTCFKVTNLTATNATTTSLTLTWTDALNTSATYSIYDMSDTSLLMSNVTGTTCVVNNLTAATTYTLGVQTNCGSDNADGFTTVTGTTPCEANTTFPWSEDFESYTANTGYSGSLTYAFNAPCWLNEHITGSGTYLFEVSTYNTTGNATKQLRLPDMSNGTQTKLMLPAMDIPTGSTYQFVIDVFRNATGTSYTSEGVRVYASTTGDITGATELGFLYRNCTQTDGNVVTAETASGWYTYEFTIPFTGTCYIILRGENQYGSATYLDNFIVREAPSCLPVSALTIDATTSSSLTLTWTDAINTSATYSIYDMSDTSLVASNISATTYTVDNLDANTAYEYGVIADCGGDLAEIRTISGRTACEAATLPWTCGFEADEIQSTTAATALPWCSERYVTPGATSGLTYPYSTASNPHDGSRSLYIYGTTSTSYPETMALILPEVDVNSYPMNGNRVTFWAKMSSASYNKYVYVATLSDPTDINTLTVIDSAEVTGTTYAKYTVSLANATATDAYVVLAVNRGSGTMYIDDVTIEEMPSCLEVPSVAVESVTSSSITLSWVANEGNASATYTIYNMANTSVVASNINDTTYTVDNLDANTVYTFAVQANCPSGDAPLTTVSGRTACSAFEAPYTWNFEDLDANATPVCWTKPAATGTTEVRSSTSNAHNSSKYLYFSGSTTNIILLPETESEANTLQLNLWLRPEGNYTSCANFSVGYVTDAADATTFVALATYNYTDFVSGSTVSYGERSVMFNAAPAGARMALRAEPTSTSYYWYVDDVTIDELPGCIPVSALTVAATTSSSITLNWLSDATNFTILDMADSSVVGTATTTTYEVTGLDANTAYTFGVTVNCGAENSDTVIVNGRTACGIIASLPWTDGMESVPSGSNQMPYCWSRYNSLASGSNYYPYSTSSSSYAHEGSRVLYWYYSTYGTYADTAIAILPELDVTTYPMNGNQLSFWGRMSTASASIAVQVGTMSDPEDATTFVASETVTVSGSTHTRYDVNLTNANATNAYAAIMVLNPSASASLYIDDVMLHVAPNCAYVTDLTVSAATAESISLSWIDANNTGATYTIYDMSDNSIVASNISTTTYTVENLDANTAYTFGVMANCAAGDAEIITVNGRTACGAIDLPYTETFAAASATRDCWTLVSNNTANAVSSPTSSNYMGFVTYSGHDVMVFNSWSSASDYNQYGYSPILDASALTGADSLHVRVVYSTHGTADQLYFGYTTTASTTPTDYTWVGPFYTSGYDAWTSFEANLPLNVVQLAVNYTSASSNYKAYVDSIEVTGFSSPEPPAPVVPEATIAASDIIYWVGTGNNQVVVAVNWADTALAWGVNFSTDSISSQAALDSIAAADPRFNYILDGSYLNNITFTEDNTTLSGDTTSYWESKRNSDYDMGLYQMLGNNDFQKWCNNAAGVAIDSTYYDGWGWSYIYNYPMAIYPVSVPAVGPIVECGVMNLPFNESFDSTSATRACWTTIDADGDSLGWTTMYNGADQGMMLSFSYDNTLGALTPDNWLISPKIHTVAGNAITMEWDIAAGNNSYYAEHYGVYVSTTTTDTAAFTLLNEWTLTSAATTPMNIDLSAYAGQDIYVAFRHFNCSDELVLLLDNVNIHEGAYEPDTLTVVLATNDATMGTTNPVPDTYQYITGDTVSFSAVANTGYHFTQWEYTAAGDTTVYTYSNENVSFLASNMMSAGTLTFTANFEADPTCVQAIPYVENFSTDYADYCWTKVNCHANTGLYNGAFRFYYSTTPPQIIISPELTGTQNGIQLAFDYRAHSANYTESFMVGYSTTTNDTSAFTWSPEVTNITNTEYVRYVENVTTSGVKYVAIKYTANDQFYLYIDSLVVRDIPSCPAVTGLTVDSATATSVFLSWTGTANSYTVYNMGDTSVIASNVAGNTYEVTGLTASTDYVFGVAANCGTETSELTTVAARTDCANGGCNITITSTGNYGFLGASIDVMQNGGLVASVNGNGVVYVCSDSPVSLVYNAGGSYDSYVSFTVADGAGIVIYTCTDGSTMTDGAVFTTIATPCPTCMPVSNLTVSNATPTSITIGWTGNATSYDVYNGSTFVANVTTNTYTFNGLTAATSYTFGVQAICSATDSAVMVNVAASTDCDDITTLPYNEGFENGLGCWTSVNGSSDGVDWSAQPAFSNGAIAPHTGTYMASSWSWNSSAMNANAWMISPKFVLPTVTAGDSLTFSWWARTNHTYPDKYSVVLSTSTNDTAAFTTVIRPYAMADTSDTWVLHTVDLTAYAGQSVYIAFHHVDYDMNYLLIDDIALVQGAYVPPAPDSIAVTYTVNDATMGSITPSGVVMTAVGDTVAATATANAGYELYGWHYTMYVGGQVYQDTTFVIDYTSVAFAIVNQSFVNYNVTITVTALFQPEVGIEDVDGSNVNIYSTDNKIVVKGAEGEDIYIYDLNGRTIATKANANETMEFTVVSGGVYLVKVGDAPAKRVLVIR